MHGGAELHHWRWRGALLTDYLYAPPPAAAAATADSRPAIVLVHGFGAFSEHWRDNVAALAAAGYHVYAPTLPGYGYSEKPVLPYGQVSRLALLLRGVCVFGGDERLISLPHADSCGGHIVSAPPSPSFACRTRGAPLSPTSCCRWCGARWCWRATPSAASSPLRWRQTSASPQPLPQLQLLAQPGGSGSSSRSRQWCRGWCWSTARGASCRATSRRRSLLRPPPPRRPLSSML